MTGQRDDEAAEGWTVLADSTARAGGRDWRRGKRPGRSAGAQRGGKLTRPPPVHAARRRDGRRGGTRQQRVRRGIDVVAFSRSARQKGSGAAGPPPPAKPRPGRA